MSLTAADTMTESVLTARPDDAVAAIARLLNEHDIGAFAGGPEAAVEPP